MGAGREGGEAKLCKHILGKALTDMDALSHATVSQPSSSDDLAE